MRLLHNPEVFGGGAYARSLPPDAPALNTQRCRCCSLQLDWGLPLGGMQVGIGGLTSGRYPPTSLRVPSAKWLIGNALDQSGTHAPCPAPVYFPIRRRTVRFWFGQFYAKGVSTGKDTHDENGDGLSSWQDGHSHAATWPERHKSNYGVPEVKLGVSGCVRSDVQVSINRAKRRP